MRNQRRVKSQSRTCARNGNDTQVESEIARFYGHS